MNIFITYFNSTQISFLIAAACCLVLSLFFQTTKKINLALVFLILTAICIFSFSALLDPFLNLWDERFHALVAKNMMNHPLMPTLYDNPIVNMEYDRWDRFHIWLHKQPLFLWQIALSFKLFGISEFTLRIPNIVLSSILVLISYRSGKLLFNQRVGYITGILIITSVFFLELVAGRHELEHNDVSFLVYVSLSIWALIEYHFSGKKRWIILIGLFSGMAILCKWLVGLLVYAGWGLLKIQQKNFKLSAYKDVFLSLLVTILVAAPWQILILLWYPSEAMKEYKYNTLHFSTAVEGHGGDIWYHFNMFDPIYGTLASLLLLPAIYVSIKRGKDRKLIYALIAMVVVVYLFFTISVTKMPSFTVVTLMLVFIAFAALFDAVLTLLQQWIKSARMNHTIFVLAILTTVMLRFDVKYFQKKHTLWKSYNDYSRMLLHNKEIYQSLKTSPKTILFNVSGRNYIDAMFYTDSPAYNFIPSLEQYRDIIKKGYHVALFRNKTTAIPEYLINDSTVIYIDKELKGYD